MQHVASGCVRCSPRVLLLCWALHLPSTWQGERGLAVLSSTDAHMFHFTCLLHVLRVPLNNRETSCAITHTETSPMCLSNVMLSIQLSCKLTARMRITPPSPHVCSPRTPTNALTILAGSSRMGITAKTLTCFTSQASLRTTVW